MNNKRIEILDLCSKAINQAEEIENEKDAHIIIKRMAHQINERIKNIQKICSVEKYRLYFNGRVGLGKSTAICTLLDLLDSSKFLDKKKVGEGLLLKTGGGRTTICETRIIPHSPESIIKINHSVSNEDFEKIIKDFSDNWLECKKCYIAEEEVRVIKNMAQIPLKLKEAEDIKEFIINEKEQDSSIYDYLLNKIDYTHRRIVALKKNIESDEFIVWFKKTYENLNDGKIRECPMPKNIDIYINDDDFKVKLPDYIECVVDTRGIDGGERKDIQDYIKADNSISLMCDEINAFGKDESLLSILGQVLIKENKDSNNRVIMLGLEREKELENIPDCEDDRKGGMEQKIAQAKRIFRNNNIYFRKDNFIFYNSMPGIILQGNSVVDYNPNEKNKAQSNFFNRIEKCIANMYSSYYEELCDSLKKLNQISNNQLTESALEKFNKCNKYVRDAKFKVQKKGNKIMQRFDDEIMSIHYPASLYGAVNHLGIGNTADVYACFRKCGGEEFSEKCNTLKENIVALINNLFENCDEMEKICLESIIDEINRDYLYIYDKSREKYEEITKNNLHNNMSWNKPKQYWGDGCGNYKRRVTNDIIEEIRDKNIDNELLELKLIQKFFDKILDFLIL